MNNDKYYETRDETHFFIIGVIMRFIFFCGYLMKKNQKNEQNYPKFDEALLKNLFYQIILPFFINSLKNRGKNIKLFNCFIHN